MVVLCSCGEEGMCTITSSGSITPVTSILPPSSHTVMPSMSSTSRLPAEVKTADFLLHPLDEGLNLGYVNGCCLAGLHSIQTVVGIDVGGEGKGFHAVALRGEH